MTNSIWEANVKQEIQTVLLEYKPKQLNFKTNKRIKKTALPLLNLLLIVLISIIVCLIIYKLFIYIVIPAVFIAILVIVEIYLIYYWKPYLIEEEILQKLDCQKYYKIAANQILSNNFKFTSFNNEFDLLPNFFWPKNGIVTPDNVLNLEYKNVKISFGTVTQTVKSQHVELDNKTRTLWNYHRYLFLTCELKQNSLDSPITIKLADTYKKALKIVANEVVSDEQFDLFFDVETEKKDVSKFLTKTAKTKLIDVLQHQQIKSNLIVVIDNDQITICFPAKLLTGLYDNSFCLANFNLASNQNFIAEDICAKILQDFNWFNDTFKWIESLDLI